MLDLMPTSDSIRRFMGSPAKVESAQPQAQLGAVVEQQVQPSGVAAVDPFALIEAQFGKAAADAARKAAGDKVVESVPSTQRIQPGIGEELMRMRMPDQPHKVDPAKVTAANRRFVGESVVERKL